MLLGLLAVFAALLLLIGRKKGLTALLGLVYTLACVWFIQVPMILRGAQPVVVTVVLVLAQAVWLFSVFYWLSDYSHLISRVGLAVSALMCLALVRKDSTAPEFKISWMILFMLMPVQGGLLYLMLSLIHI